jgi:hypothetical protein
MVSHDYDLPPAQAQQLILEPLPRLGMKLASIGWPQPLVIRQSADPPVIVHPGLGYHLRNHGVAIQSEISPEGCAEKRDLANRAAFIFQQVDIRAPEPFL